jgi:hypothetical protein
VRYTFKLKHRRSTISNAMDLPPDTLVYVFIWVSIGVVACIVSVVIED